MATKPSNSSTKPTGYPPAWGQPPGIQTRDMVPLPGGGMGSSTLKNWILTNTKKFGEPKKVTAGLPTETPALLRILNDKKTSQEDVTKVREALNKQGYTVKEKVDGSGKFYADKQQVGSGFDVKKGYYYDQENQRSVKSGYYYDPVARQELPQNNPDTKLKEERYNYRGMRDPETGMPVGIPTAQEFENFKKAGIKPGDVSVPQKLADQNGKPVLGPGTDTESARRIVPEQFSDLRDPQKLGPGGLPPEFRNGPRPGFVTMGPESLGQTYWQKAGYATQGEYWLANPEKAPRDFLQKQGDTIPEGAYPLPNGGYTWNGKEASEALNQAWKGGKPPKPPIQNTGPENIPGNNITFPNKPALKKGQPMDFLTASTITPEFDFDDPKKLKQQQLKLKQDIREAKADGDADRLKQLESKQSKLNYTIEGLNAGLNKNEAANYANREMQINDKVASKASGKTQEKAQMELEKRANAGDQRAQIELQKQKPANNFTGKSPYARTTPEESWELEKAAALGNKQAKDEIALRKQTKDETGNHTLNMSRPALDSLHGLKDTPAQREAAEFAKNKPDGRQVQIPREVPIADGKPDGRQVQIPRGNPLDGLKPDSPEYNAMKQRMAGLPQGKASIDDNVGRIVDVPRQQDKPKKPDPRFDGLKQPDPRFDGLKPDSPEYNAVKRGMAGLPPEQKTHGDPIRGERNPSTQQGGSSKAPQTPRDGRIYPTNVSGGGQEKPKSRFNQLNDENIARENAAAAAAQRAQAQRQANRDAVAQKMGYPNEAALNKAGGKIADPSGGSGGSGRGGRGGSGGGGRGGKGSGAPKGRETAKERNARMEAEADRKRDALDRKIAAGYDPATNKWTTPKSPSRLPENRKSSFPNKNNPKPSQSNSSGKIHSTWKGYGDEWAAEANKRRKAGDLLGAAEADRAAQENYNRKEGDNPYLSIPKLSDNKPSSPASSGEVGADGSLNLSQPKNNIPSTTYTPGSPNTTGRPQANNGGWNNGGGMGGSQGGGSGSGSGGGGKFVTINGQVRYFA